MAINGVLSGYDTGSAASIRKQTEAIKQRVGAATKARIAREDETGLIKNPDTGEMVELSAISEETRERWNNRLEMRTVSPGEAMILFEAADPNAESVERSKELAKTATKLQNKMFSGKTLTGKEKRWLRENNYTYLASVADCMEQEAEQLKRELARCKSKDEAQLAYMNAKTRIMGATGKNDGSFIFLSAAIDEVYSQHTKKRAAKFNILA